MHPRRGNYSTAWYCLESDALNATRENVIRVEGEKGIQDIRNILFFTFIYSLSPPLQSVGTSKIQPFRQQPARSPTACATSTDVPIRSHQNTHFPYKKKGLFSGKQAVVLPGQGMSFYKRG